MTLREIGEDRLLARLLPSLARNNGVVVAAGDDCAVVKLRGSRDLMLLKTDSVVEGVHFGKKARPFDVGWKAMARPLSDFAAMSGTPRFALVTLLAPVETTVQWTLQLYGGLNAIGRRFGVAIVGGETSNTPGPVAVSISVVGDVERDRCVQRDGGKPGDLLFVSGQLGGSLANWHLRFTPRIEEAHWLTSKFHIDAMIDLSDGLGADLPRLARASGCGFEIDEARLPRRRGCTIRQAISDGEDYELLFAFSPAEAPTLERSWQKRFPKVRLTSIGRLRANTRTRQQTSIPAGYEHFARR